MKKIIIWAFMLLLITSCSCSKKDDSEKQFTNTESITVGAFTINEIKIEKSDEDMTLIKGKLKNTINAERTPGLMEIRIYDNEEVIYTFYTTINKKLAENEETEFSVLTDADVLSKVKRVEYSFPNEGTK